MSYRLYNLQQNELAEENNNRCAIMRVQLKFVGARRGPAPALPLLPHRGLDAALNSTEEMHFSQTQLYKDTTVGCKVASPLKRCDVQVGLSHGHIHEPQ